MRTVVLSFFLLFLVGLGLVYVVHENFNTLSEAATNKTQWKKMRDKWERQYESNKAQTTKRQNAFYKLIVADTDSSRIDNLASHPYNLSMYQIRDLYDSEIQTMQKDLEGWSSEGFYSITPELSAWVQKWNQWKPTFDLMLSRGETTPAQNLFNNSVNPKSPGVPRDVQLLIQETRTMTEDMQAWAALSQNTNSRPFMAPAMPPSQIQVNTITRALDGRWEDATKQEWVPKGRPEVLSCANNPDYIRKDEIPCWNCTI
jgi:hypothetical protein